MLRSVLIVLAVLIVLWLAWLSGSMRSTRRRSAMSTAEMLRPYGGAQGAAGAAAAVAGRRQGGAGRLSQGFARSCRPPQRDVGRPLALLCGGGGPRHSHTAAPVALRRRGARRRVAGVRTGWQAVAGPS